MQGITIGLPKRFKAFINTKSFSKDLIAFVNPAIIKVAESLLNDRFAIRPWLFTLNFTKIHPCMQSFDTATESGW